MERATKPPLSCQLNTQLGKKYNESESWLRTWCFDGVALLRDTAGGIKWNEAKIFQEGIPSVARANDIHIPFLKLELLYVSGMDSGQSIKDLGKKDGQFKITIWINKVKMNR